MAKIWMFISIPNRPVAFLSTYGQWDYDKQPKIEIDEDVKKFKTFTDIVKYQKELPKFDSPTSCYFKITGDCAFYRDQQDCIVWKANSSGQVKTIQGIVANSIPEFLTRIRLESSIWYKSYGINKSALTDKEKQYIVDLGKNK
jgi:hypothetical protein